MKKELEGVKTLNNEKEEEMMIKELKEKEIKDNKEDLEMKEKENEVNEEMEEFDEYYDDGYYDDEYYCMPSLNLSDEEIDELLEHIKKNKKVLYIEKDDNSLTMKANSDNKIVLNFVDTMNSFRIYSNKLDDSLYKIAWMYVDEKEYRIAAICFSVIGASGVLKGYNDAGVCYERMEEFEKAKKYYELSPLTLSLNNIVKLYDNKHIPFDKNDYISIANKMIERKDQYGYLYLAYMYEGDFGDEYKDYSKVFGILMDGYYECEEKERICFELGYILECGIGHEVDEYFSHIMYSQCFKYDNPAGYYNFAIQLENGSGCKENKIEAIKGYILSAGLDYRDAVENLSILAYKMGEDKLGNLAVSRLQEIESGCVRFSEFDDIILNTYLNIYTDAVKKEDDGRITYKDDAPIAVKRAAKRINEKIEEKKYKNNFKKVYKKETLNGKSDNKVGEDDEYEYYEC